MRKSYASLKQYIIALTFLLTTAIIVYSCKKDWNDTKIDDSAELISEARNYFEQEILNQNLSIPNDPNFRHSITKKPLWDKAVIKQISLGLAVVVPIKFDGNVFTKPENSNQINYLNKTSYLILYKDKKRNMHVEWVTLLSDKIDNTNYRKFSGIAIIEEWSGEFKRAFSYNSSGKHISVYLNEAITYRKSSFKRSVTCVEVEYWGAAGVPGYEVPKYLGKETFCSENGSGTGGEDQGHPNNPITEEQAEPGDYITYYFDCNDDLEGSAIIDNNCGCIGGNTGIQSCPITISPWEQDVYFEDDAGSTLPTANPAKITYHANLKCSANLGAGFPVAVVDEVSDMSMTVVNGSSTTYLADGTEDSWYTVLNNKSYSHSLLGFPTISLTWSATKIVRHTVTRPNRSPESTVTSVPVSKTIVKSAYLP